MARGDPVEFVRTLLNGNRQRIGNATRREGFEIEPSHCDVPEDVGITAVVDLPAPANVQWCWRFDYIHYSYDAIIQVPGYLEITDGVTTETFYVFHTINDYLPFESTRWAAGAPVHIVLLGVGGAHGSLAVHGARIEHVILP